MNISALDLTVIVAYLVGVLGLGIWSARKRTTTANEYFLAGRSLGWVMVGAALFATNISTIHLVGLAASGYNDGMVWGNFEWMASFCLILLGLVFAPFYFRNRISTLPEYLEKRYSPGSRTFLAFMAVLGAMLIHIGMSLYAGAAVFQQFFGIDVIWSILVIAIITSIYTVLGGLRAVVVTETVQTLVLLVGAVLVTTLALLALPEHGVNSFAEFKGELKPDQFSMIHPLRGADGRLNELSWVSVILGYPILGIWYWCADQTIVQRVLGARSQRDAQIGPLFAGFLKILPVFLMVMPGVIGYVLFADVIGDDANQTLPVLINELVPAGLKGLITAGMLAALMSTIAGALNSSATLVAVDIVGRARPETPDRARITVGRVTAVVVMLLAMLWSTQGDKFTSIFEAINKIPLAFAPAITCVFVFGVFWPRGTKQASLAAMATGFVLGGIDLILDIPMIGDTRVITDVWGIPFMQQAWWLFVACSVVYVAVSLTTPAPGRRQIEGLCWTNPLAVFSGKLAGFTDPRVLAGGLCLLMAVMYWVLR
jgi:SSS family solute:Na+ symporter